MGRYVEAHLRLLEVGREIPQVSKRLNEELIRIFGSLGAKETELLDSGTVLSEQRIQGLSDSLEMKPESIRHALDAFLIWRWNVLKGN